MSRAKLVGVGLAAVVALSCGGGGGVVVATATGPAVVTASLAPDSLAVGPCIEPVCIFIPGEVQVVTTLTLRETSGAAGAVVESLAVELRSDRDGGLMVTGHFEAAGVAILGSGTNRVERGGSLTVRVPAHFTPPGAGRLPATLTVTAGLLDDSGQRTTARSTARVPAS